MNALNTLEIVEENIKSAPPCICCGEACLTMGWPWIETLNGPMHVFQQDSEFPSDCDSPTNDKSLVHPCFARRYYIFESSKLEVTYEIISD
jgi:hypothetical protein